MSAESASHVASDAETVAGPDRPRGRGFLGGPIRDAACSVPTTFRSRDPSSNNVIIHQSVAGVGERTFPPPPTRPRTDTTPPVTSPRPYLSYCANMEQSGRFFFCNKWLSRLKSEIFREGAFWRGTYVQNTPNSMASATRKGRFLGAETGGM